ncbi:lathosterol oxidase isoform X2 [Nilaparvata lugens]|nr:lathosterol oxidase isoform X2 [Nilaparvata lugens]XP_039276236.1 lathosterol oxidase isoform X2 [Nilaparvata lugens]XP_039276244.1 lathosterol oxidase isoform X2 [Nilaparvata lugens]
MIDSESLHVADALAELFWLWLICTSVGCTIYFFFGGFLHYYYYINRKEQSNNWKCQPNRWLTSDLVMDALYNGLIGLFIGNTFSAILVFYLLNDGWSLMYFNFNDYPVMWWFMQWPVTFFVQDYMVYLSHRLLHTPYMYKRYHKLHHRYKAPCPWTVTALHPVEVLLFQIVMILPIFMFPIHWVTYLSIVLYAYYCSIVDHSGVDMKAPWWQPWRADTIHHDNHHQYFHVNFGFNCYYWDMLHGTSRRSDRIYNENIFKGFGKSLKDASENEISIAEKEMASENPLAHRKDKVLTTKNTICL